MVEPQDGRPQDEGGGRFAEIIPAHPPSDMMAPPMLPLASEAMGYTARRGGGGNEVLSGLLRRKWLMISLFSLISAAIVPAIWLTVEPEYQSTAVIQVLPVVTIPYPNATDDHTIGAYQSYVNTQVGIIRSPMVLRRVLDRPQIQQTAWYTQEGRTLTGWTSPPDDRLPMDLNVQPRPMTYFIDVSMNTQKPGEGKLIVDAVVDEYLFFDSQMRDTDRTRTLKTLKDKRDDLNLQIGNLRQRIQQRSRNLGTPDTDLLRASMSTQLSELQAKKKEVERELKGLNDRIQVVTGGRAGNAATRPASEEVLFAEDADWRQLKAEVENSRHRLQVARMSRGGSHPTVRTLEADVKHAESRLAGREKQIREDGQRGAKSNVLAMNDPESLLRLRDLKQKELNYLEEDLRELSRKVDEASDVAMELVDYDQELKHAQTLYTEYQRQIEEMEAGTQAQPRVQVMSYGDSRSSASRDRRLLLTGMALVAAAGVALSIGYLRTTTDRKIHDIGQVALAGHAPFLGRLPKLKPEDLPQEVGGQTMPHGAASAMELADRAQHALMESIRMVRTALLERVSETGEKVVLITSSQEASGKTSVAVLLARSLAVVGKRVLLIEGDLRKPTLAGRLAIESGHGLAELLTGTSTEHDAKSGSRHLPFDVIAAGEIPAGFNLELLSDGVFSGCLDRWRKEYDFILLDSPPVLPIADARILAGHSDGAVMVVRAGHDRRPDTIEAFSMLASAGGRLLGTVFIGGESGRGYSYGYRYAYGYGNEYYGGGVGPGRAVSRAEGSTEAAQTPA